MVTFIQQTLNASVGRVEFTVADGGRRFDFAVARDHLEDLERTTFHTVDQWLPAFDRHKSAIRLAVEHEIALGRAGRGRRLVQL